MIYVMSDIHGQYKIFIEMLNNIKFSEKDKLYILGDVIDRGPLSFEIIKYIQQHGNIILLRGNHEQMMLNFLKVQGKKRDFRLALYYWEVWKQIGGGVTYQEFQKLNETEKEKLMEFLNDLPFYKIIPFKTCQYILCHAGMEFYPGCSVEENLKININNENILWLRGMDDIKVPKDYKLIHGHTPVQLAFGTNKITGYGNEKIINIDCGCAYGERLACLRLDDFMEFYVDVQ